jgi:hypothetical protein
MTTAGKIVVFLVLIFSLLQGGLTVVNYAAHTTWAAQNDELQKQNAVLKANADQFAVEKTKAEKDATDKLAAKDAELKKQQEELNAKSTQITDQAATEQKRKQEQLTLNAALASAQADLKRRQDENDQMKTTLAAQMDENKRMVDLNNTLRQDKITAEIKANALLARNNELESKLQDLAREVARMKSPLAGGGGKAGTGKNPPAANIEGLISKTDSSGLVKITIGSDASLEKGHTLEVFRLSPIAEQSKYLGTIKIIDVSATEAVGQPLGRMAGEVKVGDRVASRILGAN